MNGSIVWIKRTGKSPYVLVYSENGFEFHVRVVKLRQ